VLDTVLFCNVADDVAGDVLIVMSPGQIPFADYADYRLFVVYHFNVTLGRLFSLPAIFGRSH
jgi:hypothetical protein